MYLVFKDIFRSTYKKQTEFLANLYDLKQQYYKIVNGNRNNIFFCLQCAYYAGPVSNAGSENFTCATGGVTGRYLIVQVEHSEPLTLCEVEVFAGMIHQVA